MKSHVTFLSTPTVDTNGTSLLLHFDDKRYLIGSVHEGMQRVCVQEGARLSRVTDVWITGRTTWGNIGGIFGMILTLADVLQSSVQAAMEAMQKTRKHLADQTERSQKKGDQEPKDGEEGSLARFEKPTLTLHGGLNLMQTLATARKFIFRKSLPIVVNEHGRGSTVDDNWKPTWMDQNICVWAMAITPEESSPDSKGPKKRDISPRSLLNKDSEEDLETSSSSKVRRVPAEPDAGDVTEEERSRVLKGIISDMFDSDWRLDALFETPLAEVRMPATIFIRDAKTNKLERYQGPMPGGSAPVPDVQVLVRRPWPGALVTKLPRTAPSATSMSYIFRNHPQRGKFNPKAAISLGVVPGPSFRQLTLGNSVLNKQGETVLPEQVLGKGKPGGGFAVIDLPSIEYIAGLISRPEWNAQEVMVGVEAVVWKLGPGVGKDVRLQEFVQKLHGFKHVISSPDYCANYLSMDSASAAAVRHNQIDPDRFDVPIHDNRVKALPEALSHCTIAHRGIQIELEPEVVVRVSPVPILLNTAKVISEMPNHVKKAASAARSKVCSKAVQADHQKQDLPGLDVELIPLGTGSALPSKYRNVSSTLMRVPGIGSYLFDCGENTMGQLSRLYPPKELRKVLRDLKMIWISHMHADHHLGTTSVIKAWYEEVHGDASGPKTATDPEGTPTNFNFIKFIKEQKRLFIVGEASMSQWLKEYSKVEDFGYQRLAVLESRGGTSEHPSLLHWNTTPVGFNTNNRSLSEALQAATGLSSLATVYVTHCNGAQAISMTFPNGFKVSYSGDCRPSKAFAEIGKGSTVLIHEATFDDELRGDAFAKNHSTTSEAIGVGYSMGARRILLTHFSQRYQKMPKLDAINNFVVRFDDSPKKANEQLAKHSEIDLDKPALETEALDNPSRKMRGQAYDNSRDQSLSLASLSRNAKDTKVAIAFDLMRIKVRDIGLQEIFSPAFVNLYEKSILADDPVPSPDFDQLSPKQKEEQKKKRQERDKAKKVEQELFMRLRKEHKSMASNDAEGKPMQDKKGPEIGANEFTTRADEQVSQNLPAPKEATGSSSPATSPSQQTRGEKRKERRLGGGSAQDLSSSSEEDLLYENKRKKTLKQERRKAKKAQIQEPQSRHEREDSPRIMGSDIRGYIVE
ncbi:hypothetical protein MMC10_006503 [Thelotrema lepadinum]|nr:hypothetical protein [Thelotrema lepadinum]